MTGDAMRTTDDVREDLAVALAWAEPSRWEIGRLMCELRATAGEDAVWQAVPEGRGRLARVCLAVAERWPDGPWGGLEFGHYRRCLCLDSAGAAEALAQAAAGGWTPAQLGRWLAGFAPDEPAIAGMATALTGYDGGLGWGGLTLERGPDGWVVTEPDVWAPGRFGENAHQPTIGAAIKAAWRQRFGKGVRDDAA
jgi:hypothetical protein